MSSTSWYLSRGLASGLFGLAANSVRGYRSLTWAAGATAIPVLGMMLAATVASFPAEAASLGKPVASPVLGKPLRLEIPLVLSKGEKLPSSECVAVVPSSVDTQFFPLGARAAIDAGGAPRVVVATTQSINDPLLEFRLLVGCNNEFSKDFVVLTVLPTESAAKSPAPVKEGAPTSLRLERDTNLEALSLSRYPSSPALRDQFIRQMMVTNPYLFDGSPASAFKSLPAGMILAVSPNLPPPDPEGTRLVGKRLQPPRPKLSLPDFSPAPVSAAPVSAPSPSTERYELSDAPPAWPAPITNPDRLVVGSGGVSKQTATELAASIERLSQMLADQGRTEQGIMDNVNALSSSFLETRNALQSIKANTERLDTEHKQLVARVDSRSDMAGFGVVELLALIVGTGVVGAVLLVFYHRLQMQRVKVATVAPVARAKSFAFDDADMTLDIPEAATSRSAPKRPATSGGRSGGGADGADKLSEYASATFRTPEVATKPAARSSSGSSSSLQLPPLNVAASTEHTPEPPASLRRPASPPLEMPGTASVSRPADSKPAPAPHVPLEFGSGGPASSGSTAAEPDPISELASVAASHGMAKEAVAALVEKIFADPKHDLGYWLEALELHRKLGQREEFESLAKALQKHLNVKPPVWDDEPDEDVGSLEDIPRLAHQLQELWGTAEADTFLANLLQDNRHGTRQGFSREIAEEIQLLRHVLRIRGYPPPQRRDELEAVPVEVATEEPKVQRIVLSSEPLAETPKAAESDGHDIAMMLELADMYEQSGEIEGARELFQEVIVKGNAAQQERARARLAGLV